MPHSRSQTRTRSPSNAPRPSNASSSKRIRARLIPTTLSVSSSRVRKHWRPLPQPTQDRIRSLLLSISSASQSAHLNRTTKSRRGNTTNPAKVPLTSDEHTEAISAITSKLLSRLPKMHFPPTSSTARSRSATNITTTNSTAQENDFDYDLTLTQTATLSSQLTEATQSAKLLRASIIQEEADLRAERAELAGLQENLKRSTAAQRDLERRLHPLAKSIASPHERAVEEIRTTKREPGRFKTGHDAAAEEETIADATLGTARRRRHQHHPIIGAEGGAGALLSDAAIAAAADEDLQALATQLRSHLGSMAGNTAGLRGVLKEVKAAEAAVGAFAWRGMGREKYERVVGLE